MTTHYHIEIQRTNIVLKLSYRSGTFFRLERVRGKLEDKYMKKIGKIIPLTEDDIHNPEYNFSNVTYTKIVKQKSQFSKFNDAWFSFYENFTGMPPRFGAADGMHLKKIIKHLEAVGGSQGEALALWDTILAAWPKLSEFHRENTDLKYINSRLNVILTATKKALGTSGTGGANNSVSL